MTKKIKFLEFITKDMLMLRKRKIPKLTKKDFPRAVFRKPNACLT